ncbi:hypothetical protein NDU88_008324 [Pleurodeles waltl]|uniref:Uncharacterized protein n=1 Tax=Pleurodeles waltl TaxID=8319 RepID=A0AAV7QN72_PLEWA|nr:hypothetical protein NDU88_008324 [Pleurodeles waltl]
MVRHCSRVDDTLLHAVSLGDKERYAGGTLKSADMTSGDITPEVKEMTESTTSLALQKEKEEEVAEPKEQERNRSVIPMELRTTETPAQASRAEPLSVNDRTGTRPGHVSGRTWLTQLKSDGIIRGIGSCMLKDYGMDRMIIRIILEMCFGCGVATMKMQTVLLVSWLTERR